MAEKLGVTASALIRPVEGVDVLITDRGATDDALAPFLALGIEVRKA
ncbi:MAG TPA: hypothetical protein VN282_26470 [Pyrinomonadaceae bacterium]|nr:hypothetical protein [Pyrinomonadaceae bacterium]